MSYQMHASIHSMWIQVQNAYLSTSLGKFWWVARLFFNILQNLFQLALQVLKRYPIKFQKSLRLWKTIIVMDIFSFLSVMNSLIMAGFWSLLWCFQSLTGATSLNLPLFPPVFLFSSLCFLKIIPMSLAFSLRIRCCFILFLFKTLVL